MLIAANVIVALCLVSTGTIYAYVQTKLGALHVVAAPSLTPTPSTPKDTSGGLGPENILLIGNQTRSGIGTSYYGSPSELSGSLADVIMVLHLDPVKESASILSIPRDLFVPQPAGSTVGSYQKIDAALNAGDGGPDNLIRAITDDLGIPINHYIELNFLGFQRTVDALGGISMNFARPVFDSFSGLDVRQTGCQHLSGFQALAVVRARHLQYAAPGVDLEDHSTWPYDPESDLSRIVRDHAFLKEVTSTALSKGLTDPLKANGFLDGIIGQITLDPGLRDQLVKLATHYRHLNPAGAPTTTLPINQVGDVSGYSYGGRAFGAVEFANQPLANQAIAAWDANALPTPVLPSAVEVVNVTDSSHLGADIAAGLRSAGLPVTTVGDGTVQASASQTWVDYPAPGGLSTQAGVAQALSVLNQLRGAVMLRPVPELAPGVIRVEAGSAVTTVNGGSPTSSSTATTVPGTLRNLGGGSAIDPTPTGSLDKINPWDPQPC